MNELNSEMTIPATQEIPQSEINQIVWRACDTFRGAVDPSEYKNYILTMLFVKYLSDLWKDRKRELSARYGGDVQRIERALNRERFFMPESATFDALYAQRSADNLGEIINIALEAIEDANKAKLENVFRNIDFNSEPALGQTIERNRRLRQLLDDFANPRLDLTPSHHARRDVIGNVYMYLIGKFAAGAGKKAGEFYTPQEVSRLLARLVEPQPGDRICDPTCGSGSLLIEVAEQVKNADGTPSRDFSLFGQESNGATWALCRMNMFLHEQDAARIEWCDTLGNPKLIEDDRLMKFDVVVANPPFSLDKWGAESAQHDRFGRFWRGIPPKSKGDYAFISHMVETAVEGARVGVIVPHGVLFRGGSEGTIRRRMIEENVLHAVIGLPVNLFFGTGIPAAILIFKRERTTRDVLFIDASGDFAPDKRQNRLTEAHIEKIFAAFQAFETVEKYAYRATPEELEENDFNLNIARYVDTTGEAETFDIPQLRAEIAEIERELAANRLQMDAALRELGLE